MNMDSLEELRKVIETSVNMEALEQKRVSDYQLCYLMTAGPMAILDVSRRTLEEQTQDIIDYATALSCTAPPSLSAVDL